MILSCYHIIISSHDITTACHHIVSSHLYHIITSYHHIMSIEHVNLVNSRMRIALKNGDGKSFIESTLLLCEGNSDHASKVATWFSHVAKRCENRLPINADISMLRMWQLGNTDIKSVSDDWKPIFGLTKAGINKAKGTPKDQLFNTMLMNHEYQTT